MKRNLIIPVLIVACAIVALGQPAARKARVNRLPSPNVILITIDTVRADHLGYAGYQNIQTPTMDGLARDGVVFDRAISQVPLTWPSHAAILTGTYPFQNGVQDFTGQPLEPRFRSIAQAFKQNGYATGAVVSAFVLDRSFGLARGFDFYDDAFSQEQFKNRDLGLVDRRAGESVDHAVKWLSKNSRRPFFFWLHLYDPHSAYNPPEPFHSQYTEHLYDGEIAYADHELGRLIAWLKTNRLYDNSVIALLSDHGESLGDHGEQERLGNDAPCARDAGAVCGGARVPDRVGASHAGVVGGVCVDGGGARDRGDHRRRGRRGSSAGHGGGADDRAGAGRAC